MVKETFQTTYIHSPMSSNRIDLLRQKLKEFVSERDWDQFHSPKNLAMGLNIESAELLEIFLWMPDEESYLLNETKFENLKEELGDIFIYLLHLADKYGLDLIDCAEQKLMHNAAKYPAEKVKGSSRKYNEYNRE